MTEPTERPLRDLAPRDDDRGKAGAVWILYIVALFSAGLSLIVGALLAYVFRGDASPWLRSHYDEQIRIFWWGVVWAALAAVLIGIGIPLSFVIVGIPILLIGLLIAGLSWLWVLVLSIKGLARLKESRAMGALPERDF